MRLLPLCLLLLLSLSYAACTTNFLADKVALSTLLHSHQNPDGGFGLGPGQRSSLEATSYALFVSSFHNTQSDFNHGRQLSSFLDKMETRLGVMSGPPESADLESIRFLLLSRRYMHLPITELPELESHVLALYNENDHLFASKVGGVPSIHSTSVALEILSLVSTEKPQKLDSIMEEIRTVLSASKKLTPNGDGYYFDFGDKEVRASFIANYHGMVTARLVQFVFDEPQKWLNFFTTDKETSCVFFEPNQLSSQTSSMALDVRILLESFIGPFASSDYDVALKCLTNLISSSQKLDSIYHIYRIFGRLLHIPPFVPKKGFMFEGGQVIGNIVVGSHFTPFICIETTEKVVIPNLLVYAKVSSVTMEEITKLRLDWNEEQGIYSSGDMIDSSTIMGEIKVLYSVEWPSTVPYIYFFVEDRNSVGYAIEVSPTANTLSPGSTVQIPSRFDFDLDLSTQSRSDILFGDFEVVFSILDSSNNIVHKQVIDARANKQPFKFGYLLDGPNILVGSLTCLFEVRDDQGVHSQKQLQYNVEGMIIATKITIDDQTNDLSKLSLGQEFVLSMIPVIVNKDSLTNGFPLSKEGLIRHGDIEYNDPNFNVGLYYNQVSQASHPGIATTLADGTLEYKFYLGIQPTVEFIGTFQLEFYYEPHKGDQLKLEQANTSSGNTELSLRRDHWSLTILSKLQIVQPLKLPESPWRYGDNIHFSFQLSDIISNLVVDSVGNMPPRIYCQLQYQNDTSLIQHYPATFEKGSFQIKFSVGLGTLQGSSVLSLIFKHGETILPILDENQKPLNIIIDSKESLQIVHQLNQISVPETTSSLFQLIFEVLSDSQAVSGAKLLAVITNHNDIVHSQPVAIIDSSKYSFSWIIPSFIPSGLYTVQIYTDHGGEVSKSSSPIFTSKFIHHEPNSSLLYIKVESLCLVLFWILFGIFSYRKWKIEKTK